MKRKILASFLTVLILSVCAGVFVAQAQQRQRNADLMEAGFMLFPDLREDFELYFGTFLEDKKNFLVAYDDLLKGYGQFDWGRMRAVEAFFIFADSHDKLFVVDRRGEEHAGEIEEFLEDEVKVRTDWMHVDALREDLDMINQREGSFIISLFRAIEKDLEPSNMKLIFLNLGWNAYALTAVDIGLYQVLTGKFGQYFYGVEQIRK